MRFAILLAVAGAMLVGGCNNPFQPIVQNNNRSTTASNGQNAARTADATRNEDRARAANASAESEGGETDEGGKPSEGDDRGGPIATVSGASINEDWFVGRWSDYSDCRDPIDFRSNGTFVTAAGARGNWRVEDGGELILSGQGGTRRMVLTPVGSDQVRTDQGGASYRCD